MIAIFAKSIETDFDGRLKSPHRFKVNGESLVVSKQMQFSLLRCVDLISALKPNYSELLLFEYVVKQVSLPYTSVFCRFDLLSITQYSGRRQNGSFTFS